MSELKQLNFELLPVEKDLRHLIRRVFYFEEKPKQKSKVYFSPTGFAYLNFNNKKGKGVAKIEGKTCPFGKVSLGSQFRNTIPYYEFEEEFQIVSLELYPDIPFKIMRVGGEELLNNYISKMEDRIKFLHKLFDQNVGKDPEVVSKKLQGFVRQNSTNYEEDDVTKALALIYKSNGLVTQEELEAEVAIGQRQLRRKFIQQVGLSPKYYAKVVQFNHAFEIIKSEDKSMIKEVAMSAGYYDQSHFIRDFKQMVGDTPLKFFNSKNEFLKNYLGQHKQN